MSEYAIGSLLFKTDGNTGETIVEDTRKGSGFTHRIKAGEAPSIVDLPTDPWDSEYFLLIKKADSTLEAVDCASPEKKMPVKTVNTENGCLALLYSESDKELMVAYVGKKDKTPTLKMNRYKRPVSNIPTKFLGNVFGGLGVKASVVGAFVVLSGNGPEEYLVPTVYRGNVEPKLSDVPVRYNNDFVLTQSDGVVTLRSAKSLGEIENVKKDSARIALLGSSKAVVLDATDKGKPRATVYSFSYGRLNINTVAGKTADNIMNEALKGRRELEK